MRYSILREYMELCRQKGIEPTFNGLNKYDMEKEKNNEKGVSIVDRKRSKEVVA